MGLVMYHLPGYNAAVIMLKDHTVIAAGFIASEVMTLWRSTNLFIIIIIMLLLGPCLLFVYVYRVAYKMGPLHLMANIFKTNSSVCTVWAHFNYILS